MKLTKAEKQFIKENYQLDPNDLTEKGIEAMRKSLGYSRWKLSQETKELKKALFDCLPKFIQKIIKRIK